MEQTTENSRIIKSAASKIYEALTSPKALEIWQVPGDMTGKVHSFDLREGGGYTMSIFYPESENTTPGKTSSKEDRFTAKFVKLEPSKRIVETVIFDTDDPKFSGEMTMTVSLSPVAEGTKVTFLFENIPMGIKPEDNEAGTASSLQKLADYTEKD